jgi:hypothetical protein
MVYVNDCEQLNFNTQKRMIANNELQNSNKSSLIQVYPNPSTGIINISWSEDLKNQQIDFLLFNMLGQAVKSTVISTVNENSLINIEELSNGIYFYFVKQQNNTLSSGKIILEKP